MKDTSTVNAGFVKLRLVVTRDENKGGKE